MELSNRRIIALWPILLVVFCLRITANAATETSQVNSLDSCEITIRSDVDSTIGKLMITHNGGSGFYSLTRSNIVFPNQLCDSILQRIDTLFIRRRNEPIIQQYKHDVQFSEGGSTSLLFRLKLSNQQIIETSWIPCQAFSSHKYYVFSKSYDSLLQNLASVLPGWKGNEYFFNPDLASLNLLPDSIEKVVYKVYNTPYNDYLKLSQSYIDSLVEAKHKRDGLIFEETNEDKGIEKILFLDALRRNLETYSDSMRTELMIFSKMYREESSSMEDYATFILYLQHHSTEEASEGVWENIYEMYKAYPKKSMSWSIT